MSEKISIILNAVIEAKKQNLNSYFDGETEFIFDDEYDRYFSIELDNAFIYSDSTRGTNPYSGTEALIDKNTGAKLWICDYTGCFMQTPDFDPAYVLHVIKSGRTKYLETCKSNLMTNISFEDEGYIFMTETEGSIKSMRHLESVKFGDRNLYLQLSNQMLRV